MYKKTKDFRYGWQKFSLRERRVRIKNSGTKLQRASLVLSAYLNSRPAVPKVWSQIKTNHMTHEPVRNSLGLTVDLLNQKLEGWDPDTWELTNPPADGTEV